MYVGLLLDPISHPGFAIGRSLYSLLDPSESISRLLIRDLISDEYVAVPL